MHAKLENEYGNDCVCIIQLLLVICSVRPILRISEYSLVALQYRRIRYIGLRVSADTDTPAAIMINSNLTRRLKHMVCVDRMWLQMRPAFLFTFRGTDCRCNTSRHQRHPAALHAAWTRGASITDTAGKRMPVCQRDRPAVEIWHTDLQHWLCLVLSKHTWCVHLTFNVQTPHYTQTT